MGEEKGPDHGKRSGSELGQCNHRRVEKGNLVRGPCMGVL